MELDEKYSRQRNRAGKLCGGLWNGEYGISTLVQAGLVTYVALAVSAFAIGGGNELVDIATILLVGTLSGVLVISLYTSDDLNYPHNILLASVIGVFFLPRVIFYMILGEELLRFPFDPGFSSFQVNRGLLYLILGSILLMIGFRIGSWIWRNVIQESRRDKETRVWFHLVGLVGLWFVVGVVEGYFMIWKGASVFNLSTALMPGLWLIHFFSLDTVALLTIVVSLSDRRFLQENRRVLSCLGFFYLAVSILEGSRGGPIRLGLMVGMFLLAYEGNFRTNLRKVVGFVLLIVLLEFMVYPIGTGVRYYRSGADDPGALVSKEFGFEERNLRGPLIGFAAAVGNRMGYLDYVVGILTKKGDKDELDRYMNFRYPLKVIINNVVLGSPFPEAEIMTSRVMPIVYRGRNERDVRESFLSEPWTIWGLAYVYFGWWWGLGALSIASICLQLGFLCIRDFLGPYGDYAGTYYLFGSSFAGFFLNSGLDHWITIVFYFTLSSITAFVLLRVLSHGVCVLENTLA